MGRRQPTGSRASESRAVKVCATCGRAFEWRAKWAADWSQVRYCSKRCRGGLTSWDRELEKAILGLLDGRPRTATICPSEAARQVGGASWRELMEPSRAAARRLVALGQAEILQRGRVVDPSTARGPIRVRRANLG
jgi:hypothetical protein